MKNVLLLTTKYPEKAEDSWLTNELAECIFSRGFDVQVIVLSWEFDHGETKSSILNGVKIHRLRLPWFMYRKNFFFSTLKILLFSFIARIKFRSIIHNADITIATTPCVSKWALIKKTNKIHSHLILWDFFPYYTKGIWGAGKRILTHPFLVWENSLFNKFNRISCMTNEAVLFLKSHYSISQNIVTDVVPLWTRQRPKIKYSLNEINETRKEFNIRTDAFVVVYGGAITKIQNLSSILDVAKSLLECDDLQFVIVGSGPDLQNLKSKATEELISNVVFIDRVNRDVYGQLISACDVGIVSLSALHEVPSFPSKTIDYLKVGLPVIAYIDGATEFGSILENQMRAGFAVMNGNINGFVETILLLKSNKNLRERMSQNGRIYYEKYFNVDFAVDQILKSVNTDVLQS